MSKWSLKKEAKQQRAIKTGEFYIIVSDQSFVPNMGDKRTAAIKKSANKKYLY